MADGSPAITPTQVAAVFIGGLVGTALRVAVDAAVPATDAAFPVSTLAVNVLGSFALGALVSRVWPVAPAWLRVGLGAGLLGSFTTFSAIVVTVVDAIDAGSSGTAVLYLVLTLALGLAAAIAGLALGRRHRPIGSDE